MLEPDARKIYLAELRPPAGYVLDRAVTTTFSLDLLPLLMAPLSMAFSECTDRDEVLHDPIAALEAIRRTAGRFAVFCQQGRIAVPRADSRLFSYLESAVVEVRAPGGGTFHPKVWLLRYLAPDEPVYYRFLCLSRNLTLDRSWDTVLTLEGVVEDRRNGYSGNRPLADFLQALPDMAVNPVPEAVRQHVTVMAGEIRRVKSFSVGESLAGVDGLEFHPSGIRGHRRPPALSDYRRLLVVSPFVSVEGLRSLAEQGENNVLVTRGESLDELPVGALAEIAARTSLFVMDDQAERPEPEETVVAEESNLGDDLSGLHAKLYISENGWRASLFTGSANATAAAWNGKNVEFMVELRGMRSAIGIDRFLDNGSDRSFDTLLRPYRGQVAPPPNAAVRKRLEEMLDAARTALGAAGLTAEVVRDGADTYALIVRPVGPFAIGEGVLGRCYPISLKAPSALDVVPMMEGEAVTFSGVSVPGLTGFFAFTLIATVSGQKAGVTFVLNLPVAGLPADRDNHILHSIISDRRRFIRYLLFLLAEGSDTLPLQALLAQGETGAAAGEAGPEALELPLLEELVRAFSRQPEKIDRIGQVIADLTATAEGRAVIPPGLLDVWASFAAARAGEVGRA